MERYAEEIEMRKKNIRVCILRVGGTNCDAETKRALDDLDVRADVVHANEVIERRTLLDYDALVLPGGFSYGDYVRAGVIWAKRILVKLGTEFKAFVEEKRPILGICNGFQVLVEMGLLPGYVGLGKQSEATLAINTSGSYECRWIHLRHENSGKCVFTKNIRKSDQLFIPVAHTEGRFLFPKEQENEYLKRLYENDQLVLRYCDSYGEYAEGRFPDNPNGAFHDIAGICDSTGTIFGLMPHPERAYHGWQLPDWTRREVIPKYGDGRIIFESMIEYLESI